MQQVKQLGTSGFTRYFSYISGKNKLEEVEIGLNSYNFTYDVCGNQLTENITRQFEWDAGNRLILFKNQTGSSEPSVIAQYLYDSAGNRVKKIVRKQGGSYEIRTYIDGIFEHFTDETEEQNTVHIMDDQSRVATVRIGDAMGDVTPAVKYNLENNIYSSAVTLNDNGTIVNSQEYYPFGETSFGSYGKKRYQYVGKERDEESGLYYYGARYYAPWIARFISCDPLSAKYAQLSPYNYSDNNPINDYDIDGMQNNNSEGSEQGGTPPPNTIVIDTSKDKREFTSSYLPKTAADGQRIDLVDPNSTLKNQRLINVYNAEKGKWGTTVTYENSVTGKTEFSPTKYQEGWVEESTLLQSGDNSTETTAEKVGKGVVNTIDKVASNKTVGDVAAGGGIVSQMVEVSAESTKKEIISDVKRVNKVIVRHRMNVKLSGAWKKTAKTFSKIANVAKWAGRVFGGVDTVVNLINAIKIGRDKNASTWKKAGAILNVVASATGFLIKATPLGFALSLGITVFTSWWNK